MKKSIVESIEDNDEKVLYYTGNREVPDDWSDEIVLAKREIIRRYDHHWQLNDPAHQFAHFQNVFQTGLKINTELELGYRPYMILLVAFFHDLFAWTRINHHSLSAEFVMTCEDPLFTRLSTQERWLVSKACAEHRASFKGEFSSSFSELMNSADRELPGNIRYNIERCINAKMFIDRLEREEALPRALEHMKKKYGVAGYARVPDMYMRVFGEKHREFREKIEALTLDDIR